MQHKYTTLATSKTEWTTSAGIQMVAGYELIEESRELFGGTGKYTRSDLGCHLYATVNGVREPNAYTVVPLIGRADGLVAKIGRIGLDANKLAAVNATRAEIESHPEWMALMATRAAGDKIRREFAAGQRHLDNMMTLNGHSF